MESMTRFFAIPIITGALIFGFVCPYMAHHISASAPRADSVVVAWGASYEKCCSSGISKNVGQWKSILLAAPREARGGTILLILGLAIAFALSNFRLRHNSKNDLLSYMPYARDNPDFLLFNHLKISFARGILNPKIY
ncbi:MAG: hypothetical protein A2946_01250 [Candidatus Liptonbacteria bacterium RIFCSPLOWO2_01_FULL_53_13]|uniref:Uncharacterized protein n=1 Tax=Candidatus Liptonbacteria bacterium RIFCSPLOWO2_01_FULL_53_13 TaxID=1798651 RepID=A0A1G2CME6_9BACT|nr:MAG: hypothetical protein A2946_01250 [Candidatus Liptonbacteria bacterium RIFCSPLOWO2_01_FULL_53_13]